MRPHPPAQHLSAADPHRAGLSYAGVAGLPAIFGLYTDFLPLFLYFWFGSSRYLQVGAVAVVSLLTANTVR